MLNHLCVAAANEYSGVSGRFGHRANLRFKDLRRQPCLQHKGHHQSLCSRTGNSQIVHGSIHCQFADASTWKAQRLDDEAVRRHRDSSSIDVEMRGIAQRLCRRAKQKRSEEPFY